MSARRSEGGGCHGLILAGGASSRMGTPKALLAFHGRTFVGHLAEALRAGGCASVTVVGGAHAEPIRAAVPSWARYVVATAWAEGMRASLRAGLLAMPPGAVLLTHVDRPGVAVETVRALIEAPSGGPVIPEYAGQGGHPVRVPAVLRPRLVEPGDAPLRDFMGGATRLPVDDPMVLRNVNTPEDYIAAVS